MNGSATRRQLLRGAGAALLLPPALVGCSVFDRLSWRKADPFQLGVASGAPSIDGFVIWTRLAPDPLANDPATPGGMAGGPVPLAYEIARDDQMRDIVQRGTASAEPGYAYSVHAEIAGLEAGRSYWYRFSSGDAQSRIGRAMTLPPQGAAMDKLKFAYVSCSNYEHGYFSAYRHLADEAPDFAVFLGDYIYEYADQRGGTVRKHSDGVEAKTLPLYRNRYAQYRTDPDLQRLHALAPALVTWDDHEVQNDYADRWSQTFDDPAEFLKRRAAAYQAYYEHMPLRAMSKPSGPAMQLFSRYDFGQLMRISLLDGRQYRSRQACYAPPKSGGGHLVTDKACGERRDPKRSMLGLAQEQWVFDGFTGTKTGWNVVAQDVLMSQLREKQPNGDIAFWTDDWNGYPASRRRLLDHLDKSKAKNPVVLTGDIHSFWVNDLKRDFDDPHSRTIATELVGTSVTAHPAAYEMFTAFLPDNPHVKFFESRKRGYVSVELTAAQLTARLQTISDETKPDAGLSTLKTFVVESGKPGAQEA